MTKTVAISDDLHIRLSQIQLNLRKLGIEKRMPDIADIAMTYGIDNAFDKLKEVQSENKSENRNDKNNNIST